MSHDYLIQTDSRTEASQYVDRYADPDAEPEYYLALIEDDVFGTLAHCRRRLASELRVGDTDAAVDDSVENAIASIDDALGTQAANIRVDGEFMHDEFDDVCRKVWVKTDG